MWCQGAEHTQKTKTKQKLKFSSPPAPSESRETSQQRGYKNNSHSCRSSSTLLLLLLLWVVEVCDGLKWRQRCQVTPPSRAHHLPRDMSVKVSGRGPSLTAASDLLHESSITFTLQRCAGGWGDSCHLLQQKLLRHETFAFFRFFFSPTSSLIVLAVS